MSTLTPRQRATDLLLGRTTPDLDALGRVPASLRSRVARREAVQALVSGGSLSALEAAALVRAALGDSDAEVRVQALVGLARTGSPALATPVLLACAADPVEQVSVAARAALARFELDGIRVPRAHQKPANVLSERVPEIL